MKGTSGLAAGKPVRYNFKVVLAGPWGVGKTSLVRKFVEKKFEQDYLPTIGASVMIKEVTLTVRGQDLNAHLSIWDIAAEDAFKVMRATFYGGARGALVVADLSRPQSFAAVPGWAVELRGHLPQIPIVFLANKCDLKYTIDEGYIEEIGKQVGALKTFKTSALSGANVQEAFHFLAENMIK